MAKRKAKDEALPAELLALVEDGIARAEYYPRALAYLRARGSNHWWCEHGPIMAPLLLPLAKRAPTPEPVRDANYAAEVMLTRCWQCARAYYRHRSRFLQRTARDHGSDDEYRRALVSIESSRVLQACVAPDSMDCEDVRGRAIAATSPASRAGLLHTHRGIAFALTHSVDLATDEKVNACCYPVLFARAGSADWAELARMGLTNACNPVAHVLAVHPNASVRKWAMHALKTAPKSKSLSHGAGRIYRYLCRALNQQGSRGLACRALAMSLASPAVTPQVVQSRILRTAPAIVRRLVRLLQPPLPSEQRAAAIIDSLKQLALKSRGAGALLWKCLAPIRPDDVWQGIKGVLIAYSKLHSACLGCLPHLAAVLDASDPKTLSASIGALVRVIMSQIDVDTDAAWRALLSILDRGLRPGRPPTAASSSSSDQTDTRVAWRKAALATIGVWGSALASRACAGGHRDHLRRAVRLCIEILTASTCLFYKSRMRDQLWATPPRQVPPALHKTLIERLGRESLPLQGFAEYITALSRSRVSKAMVDPGAVHPAEADQAPNAIAAEALLRLLAESAPHKATHDALLSLVQAGVGAAAAGARMASVRRFVSMRPPSAARAVEPLLTGRDMAGIDSKYTLVAAATSQRSSASTHRLVLVLGAILTQTEHSGTQSRCVLACLSPAAARGLMDAIRVLLRAGPPTSDEEPLLEQNTVALLELSRRVLFEGPPGKPQFWQSQHGASITSLRITDPNAMRSWLASPTLAIRKRWFNLLSVLCLEGSSPPLRDALAETLKKHKDILKTLVRKDVLPEADRDKALRLLPACGHGNVGAHWSDGLFKRQSVGAENAAILARMRRPPPPPPSAPAPIARIPRKRPRRAETPPPVDMTTQNVIDLTQHRPRKRPSRLSAEYARQRQQRKFDALENVYKQSSAGRREPTQPMKRVSLAQQIAQQQRQGLTKAHRSRAPGRPGAAGAMRRSRSPARRSSTATPENPERQNALADLHGFRRQVLAWPPDQLATRVKEALGASVPAAPRSNPRFRTVAEYQKATHALFLEDVRAGLEAAVNQMTRFGSRSLSSECLWDGTTLSSTSKHNGTVVRAHLKLPSVQTNRHNAGHGPTPGDILVITVAATHETQASATRGDCKQRHEPCPSHSALALVLPLPKSEAGQRREKNAEQTHQLSLFVSFENLWGVPRARAVRAAVCSSASVAARAVKWHACRLDFAFRTVEREFTALAGLGQLPTWRSILGRPHAGTRSAQVSAADATGVVPASVRAGLNPSQTQAIGRVLSSGSGFSLIQGPPGTGKTRTVVGLINALLAQRRALTARDVRSDASLSKRTNGRRVLVCAPSNAAVDEIVLRIAKTGMVQANGQPLKPRVVRLGQSPSLEGPTAGGPDTDILRKASLDSVAAERRRVGRSGGGDVRGEGAAETRRARAIDESDVVCATLSGSGMAVLGLCKGRFDALIVDEAAQAVEPATLIPLRLHPRVTVLVGDPRQLRATVISASSTKAGYGRSLFERLESLGVRSDMLRTQYRMNPAISAFPSREFYGGRLADAPRLLHRPLPEPWNAQSSAQQWSPPPYRFFNLTQSREARSGRDGISLRNPTEARFAVRLFGHLAKKMRPGSTPHWFSSHVGVITPYKHQVRALRREFSMLLGSAAGKALEISTVDGFQGREKNVIIVSCVRANQSGGVGFLRDQNRLNVAITRAKHALYILGNASTLSAGSPAWQRLVQDAQTRKFLVHVKEDPDTYWDRAN